MKMSNVCKMIMAGVVCIFSSLVFAKTETAIFSAGCFWCAEDAFEKVVGVEKVISGYTGGSVKSPTYEQVSAGNTGHYEAVEVYFDPEKTSYSKLLDVFWKNIDPIDADGQFCDKGQQYKAVIFYNSSEQKKLAEESKNELSKTGRFKVITTAILPASEFYPAEEYHQGYAKKNPVQYQNYKFQCGRRQRLEQVWGNE